VIISSLNQIAAGAGQLIEEFGTYDMFKSTHVFGTCLARAEWGRSLTSQL